MDRSNNEPSREYILLKEEVDALQVSIMRANKPWYKEISSLVAIAALILSIVTTFLSFIDGSKKRLNVHIKELVELPNEYAEIQDKYRNNPAMLSVLSAQFNQRNQVLAKLAVNDIESIENNLLGSNIILPIEYLTVAQALSYSFNYDKAKAYYSKAADLSDDYSVAVGAIRSIASISLTESNVEELRNQMGNALNLSKERRFTNLNNLTKLMTDSTTESQWAMAEFQLRNCDAGNEHYHKAKQLLSNMPDSPIKQQIQAQLEYTKNLNVQCSG